MFSRHMAGRLVCRDFVRARTLRVLTRIAIAGAILAVSCLATQSPEPHLPSSPFISIDRPAPADASHVQKISVTETSPPPSWVYGHWVWEDESTQDSAVRLVDSYLDRGITVTAVIIDSPWETAYNTFEPDPNRFQDFAGMVAYFHSRGVKVIVWITGVMNLEARSEYELAARKGFFMTEGPQRSPKVVRWWKGQGSLVDFFNPEAVQWWGSLMDKALSLGVDGFKVDATDPYVVAAPWSPYLSRQVSPLEYSRQYYATLYQITRLARGADAMITARPVDTQRRDPGPKAALAHSFSPPEIGWSGWVGDQLSSFDPNHYTGIRGALLNFYYSSELGYFGFGSDIGGYIAPPGSVVPRDLLLRWAALGAFSPVMENGGIAEHRPFGYGPEATEAYARFVRIHMALVPYILELAHRFPIEQQSAMRFLDRRTFSYTLGPDIFVQPIIDESGASDVRLPDQGSWRYLFDPGRIYNGDTRLEMKVPLDEYPVFVRDGSPLLEPLSRAVMPPGEGGH